VSPAVPGLSRRFCHPDHGRNYHVSCVRPWSCGPFAQLSTTPRTHRGVLAGRRPQPRLSRDDLCALWFGEPLGDCATARGGGSTSENLRPPSAAGETAGRTASHATSVSASPSLLCTSTVRSRMRRSSGRCVSSATLGCAATRVTFAREPAYVHQWTSSRSRLRTVPRKGHEVGALSTDPFELGRGALRDGDLRFLAEDDLTPGAAQREPRRALAHPSTAFLRAIGRLDDAPPPLPVNVGDFLRTCRQGDDARPVCLPRETTGSMLPRSSRPWRTVNSGLTVNTTPGP
jgi:hypothetical protein